MKEALDLALQQAGLLGVPGTYSRVEAIDDCGKYIVAWNPFQGIPCILRNHLSLPFDSNIFIKGVFKRINLGEVLLLDDANLKPGDPTQIAAMRGFFLADGKLYDLRRWDDETNNYLHEAISLGQIDELNFVNGIMEIAGDRERNGYFRLDITYSRYRRGRERIFSVIANLEGSERGEVINSSVEWFNQRIERQKLPLWRVL